MWAKDKLWDSQGDRWECEISAEYLNKPLHFRLRKWINETVAMNLANLTIITDAVQVHWRSVHEKVVRGVPDPQFFHATAANTHSGRHATCSGKASSRSDIQAIIGCGRWWPRSLSTHPSMYNSSPSPPPLSPPPPLSSTHQRSKNKFLSKTQKTCTMTL